MIFDGKAAGVREGGILNVARREVEIECLPTAIPESLVIDITNLELNYPNLHHQLNNHAVVYSILPNTTYLPGHL